MTDHFKPLWARNVPKFGIGHAMALGVSCCHLSYRRPACEIINVILCRLVFAKNSPLYFD